MENSKIEWCDHTFNPWVGCAKVSPGCAHCYAESIVERFGKDFAKRSRTKPAEWVKPIKWDKEAATSGTRVERVPTRPKVFCLSMGDWLDEAVPIEWLADLLKLIHETPNLDWLLLTKRPENFFERLRDAHFELAKRVWCRTAPAAVANWVGKWMANDVAPENVWIGNTVENQEYADKRIPELLKIPAKVRFLSCEPLLGSVDVEDYLDDLVDGGYVLGSAPIHWVICGGESGRKARPMHPDWARSLRDQCQAAGVPFFMKQMGGARDKRAQLSDLPEDLRVRNFPEVQHARH